MSIPVEDIGIAEVCFTHVHNDEATTIAVERLLKDPEVMQLEVFLTPVEEEFAKYCMEHRGIEQRRLDRLTSADLARPLCYCDFPRPDMGGAIAHLLIDGNHRFVKAAMWGIKQLPAQIVPERLWRKYVVTGIPLEFQKAFIVSPSGMP